MEEGQRHINQTYNNYGEQEVLILVVMEEGQRHLLQ